MLLINSLTCGPLCKWCPHTALVISVTEPIGYVRPGKGEARPSIDLCNKAVVVLNISIAVWPREICRRHICFFRR